MSKIFEPRVDDKIQDFNEQIRAAADRLFALIDQFSQTRVLVVGDLTLDEFLTGQVERISREAPVLILRHEHTRQIPGGGANAVYNFAKLGAQVKVVGLVGKDTQGEAMARIFSEAGIDISGMLLDPYRPTVTKTRISGHARQSVTQQIVRVDRKSDDPADPELQLQLAEFIKAQLDQDSQDIQAIICSDYGDGVLNPAVIAAVLSSRVSQQEATAVIGNGQDNQIQQVTEANQPDQVNQSHQPHQIPIIVDTQKDLHRFAGATLFTPNLPEAELAVGYRIKDAQTLTQAGKDLLALTQAEKMLITRGEEGMTLFDRDGSEFHIPAFNRTDVFDVTGAGDTVVAALTLALCCGATFWEAAVLGNLAASIVVRVFGTATTNTSELKAALHNFLEEGI
ncbi:MAG: D-glycero-beta-D-manno-heptose-7-phosphate kinase [Coleofasciculaceae cyanobacterium SM2_1_6]|nr:D-glycero-beta-D-manno-heptose-7-phosphate kinase [Coleofasciculaceae cyanobacterium SM2_1_6]